MRIEDTGFLTENNTLLNKEIFPRLHNFIARQNGVVLSSTANGLLCYDEGGWYILTKRPRRVEFSDETRRYPIAFTRNVVPGVTIGIDSVESVLDDDHLTIFREKAGAWLSNEERLEILLEILQG